jgi:vanillate O-demethylase ferredoxin subunit
MSPTPSTTEHFYDAHLLVCINEREDGHPRGSCSLRGSVDLHKYMKTKSKELGIKNIRVNKAGCLDRCELGPVMVIYPEGIWYGINSTEDVDQILQRHILNGVHVDHLILANDQEFPHPSEDAELHLEITHIKDLTPAIKEFELRSPEGRGLPEFSAGSHIDIKFNDELRRSYSLTNAPSTQGKYVIAVLEEVDSKGGSRWMHNDVSEGDVVTVTRPENNFELVKNASEHLFIAGGIGITPIISMGRFLQENGKNSVLHYCTKSEEKTAYTSEVQNIFGENLTMYHDGGDVTKGIDLISTLKTRADGAHLYVCGPKGMIDAALDAASHWPEGTVHYELFSGADDLDRDDDKTFTVVLKQSDVTIAVPAGTSIVQAIRSAGIEINTACESGVCGTCQTDLLGGEADHRDEILSPAEQDAQTTLLPCVSRAKPGETLILDL